MALVCYLDDSGNKDDSISTLAGYIAPAHNWLEFEVHVRKLFDAIKLPYLHTVDLHMRRKEFKGWTREQTAKFTDLFYKILAQHTYAGFEFSVLKSTFEAKKSIYNVEPPILANRILSAWHRGSISQRRRRQSRARPAGR